MSLNDKNWRPYCLKCSTMKRMVKTSYGFICTHCNNKIKEDLTHYDFETP